MVKRVQFNIYRSPSSSNADAGSPNTGHVNITFAENNLTIGATADKFGPNALPLLDSQGTDGAVLKENDYLEFTSRVSRSVPVTDEQYDYLLGQMQSQIGSRYDYDLFSQACVDFAQAAYEATGHPGHFGSLFHPSEVSGPIALRIQEGMLIVHEGSAREGGFSWGRYAPSEPVAWEDGPPTVRKFTTHNQLCFLAGAPITMWDGTVKPIEEIRPDDLVLSFDEKGRKVPGRVTRTFVNHSPHILNFHGSGLRRGTPIIARAASMGGVTRP